jgi:hypothetical protein
MLLFGCDLNITRQKARRALKWKLFQGRFSFLRPGTAGFRSVSG